MTTASVSVIIPTHDRCGSLERLLHALGRQTWHPRPLEVIVVADGCHDATEARVREAWPAISLIELHGSGAATARNRGARAATHDLLVFLDDDMEPVPDLVEHYAAAAAPDLVLIGMSPPMRGGRGFLAASARAWWEHQYRNMADPGHQYSYRDMLSGNFAIGRERFLALNGFDEGLRCREDYEFGIRAIEAGVSLQFVPGARATHHDLPHLRGALRRAAHEGGADACIAGRHPSAAPSMLVSHFTDHRPWLARSMNRMAFRAPRRGDRWAGRLHRLLGLLERLRMRRAWRGLFGLLREYRYWRGVSAEMSLEVVLDLPDQAPDRATGVEVIELRDGLDPAALQLERARPRAAVVRLHGIRIGHLPAVAGGEPLKVNHLRATLAGPLAGRYAAITAAGGARKTPLGAELPTEVPTVLPEEPGWWQDFRRPRLVGDLELAAGVPSLNFEPRYSWAQLLVRNHGRPVGWVRVARGAGRPVPATTVLEAVVDQAGKQLRPLLFHRTIGEAPVLDPVSVIVCTRDRPELLDGCLSALREQDHPQYEVIVVDNAPTRDDTARVAERHGATLVREPRPGLDWARNRGLAAARHDLVAYTDDDARPDPGWLTALARRFDEPGVQAVTGLVTPLELDTRAQLLFEEVYGGMGKGFTARRVEGRALEPAARLAAWRFGVGANMAFRREALERLGGFDTALDVGTPSHGGGDLDMFYRMLASGHVLAYEPGALVRHRHRREMSELRRQLRDDGRAFGVYLIKRWQAGDAPRGALLRFAFGHWVPWLFGRIAVGLIGRHRLPLPLLWASLQGALGAPVAWVFTRRSDRRLRTVAAPHTVGGTD